MEDLGAIEQSPELEKTVVIKNSSNPFGVSEATTSSTEDTVNLTRIR